MDTLDLKQFAEETIAGTIEYKKKNLQERVILSYIVPIMGPIGIMPTTGFSNPDMYGFAVSVTAKKMKAIGIVFLADTSAISVPKLLLKKHGIVPDGTNHDLCRALINKDFSRNKIDSTYLQPYRQNAIVCIIKGVNSDPIIITEAYTEKDGILTFTRDESLKSAMGITFPDWWGTEGDKLPEVPDSELKMLTGENLDKEVAFNTSDYKPLPTGMAN